MKSVGCRILLGCVLVIAPTPRAMAQTVTLRTNYFKVTGTNFHEIRRSIALFKPWGDNFDATTSWNVNWKFTLVPSSSHGCTCSAISTVTTIVVTMPWWVAPTNATPEARSRWQTFYQALAAHEGGHVEIARAAGAAVQSRLGEITTSSDCGSLRAQLNETANRVVAEHQASEREFDRKTQHGRTSLER
jgi:predicted secreted Zn-dependent protease